MLFRVATLADHGFSFYQNCKDENEQNRSNACILETKRNMRKAQWLIRLLSASCAAFDVTQGFAPYLLSRSRFVLQEGTAAHRSRILSFMAPPATEDSGKDDDIPQEELIGGDSHASSSNVDWDAEWRKVVRDQKQGKKVERPGTEYYKTEAEIKAIQAANKAAFEAQKVKASFPTWQMLKGDWKVRVCVCVGAKF